jgi:hypothetical protein
MAKLIATPGARPGEAKVINFLRNALLADRLQDRFDRQAVTHLSLA